MPTYNYQCKKCHQSFEVQATIKQKVDGLKVTCPKCKSHQTRQVLTAPAIALNVVKEANQTVSCCGSGSNSGCCG